MTNKDMISTLYNSLDLSEALLKIAVRDEDLKRMKELNLLMTEIKSSIIEIQKDLIQYKKGS